MKRTLILLATLVGFATNANAASLVLTSDAATYSLLQTIVLTVTGTATTPTPRRACSLRCATRRASRRA